MRTFTRKRRLAEFHKDALNQLSLSPPACIETSLWQQQSRTPSVTDRGKSMASNSRPPSAAAAAADSARPQKRTHSKLYESRQFIIETYTVWASLQVSSPFNLALPLSLPSSSSLTCFPSLPQRIVADYKTEAIAQHGLQAGIPPPAQVQYYARVCRLYKEAIVKQLALIKVRSPFLIDSTDIPVKLTITRGAQNNTELTPAQKAKSHAHYANMHAILALTEILYLPADGRGEGLVAEEILDWVNTVDKGQSVPSLARQTSGKGHIG